MYLVNIAKNLKCDELPIEYCFLQISLIIEKQTKIGRKGH